MVVADAPPVLDDGGGCRVPDAPVERGRFLGRAGLRCEIEGDTRALSIRVGEMDGHERVLGDGFAGGLVQRGKGAPAGSGFDCRFAINRIDSVRRAVVGCESCLDSLSTPLSPRFKQESARSLSVRVAEDDMLGLLNPRNLPSVLEKAVLPCS